MSEALPAIPAPLSSPKEKPAVDRGIDDDDHRSKHELHLPGEASWVDDRYEIVLDEAGCITRLTALGAEMVFEVGKGANSARELHKEPPGSRRQMEGGKPAPPHCEYCAKQGEQDKCQMDYEDNVGREKVQQLTRSEAPKERAGLAEGGPPADLVPLVSTAQQLWA